MGLRDWLLGRPLTYETVAPSTFAVDAASAAPEFFGFATSTADPIAPATKISRASARQIPAVKRARDIICGTLGGIPMQVLDRNSDVSVNSLLDQPEADVPRSVTFTRLFEDLLYDAVAWWRIVETDYRGKPVSVVRVDPSRVTVADGNVTIDGRKVSDPARTLIRFDSPNGALLADGARAFRTLLRLEASAANQAEDPQPQGFFTPKDDVDPFVDDDEVRDFLTSWKRSRQAGSTAYVPAAVDYKTNQFSPEQLQLVEARQHAVLEVARCTGIDAEDLSVSTSSRTYFNGQDRRQQRISDVLGPYSLAVTDRLRMRDITPLGYEVRADFSAFLRADDKTRLQNYQVGLAMGLYDLAYVAAREGVPVPDGVEQTAKPSLSVVQIPTRKEIAQ